jgi:hypothetical protein
VRKSQEGSDVMDQIGVRIVSFSNRKTYQLQWSDPVTGKKKTKSSTVIRPPRDAGTHQLKQSLLAAAAEASSLAKQLAVTQSKAANRQNAGIGRAQSGLNDG